jgi:murein DD-endopeptidase MepM/ murein hydrolase activator NlpD
MTPVVAPFDGTFGKKINTFWVYGDNGWKCLGTHLNNDTPGTGDNSANPDFMFAPNLRHGDKVRAGQLVGYVGDSGKATGPHLHFELHSDKGIRNPTRALQGATKLITPLSEIGNMDDKPEATQERYEVCKRAWSSGTGVFYGLLMAKQYDTGRVLISTNPRYVTFNFPKQLLTAIDPEQWPKDRPASIYFAREGNGVLITKIVPPTN